MYIAKCIVKGLSALIWRVLDVWANKYLKKVHNQKELAYCVLSPVDIEIWVSRKRFKVL